MKFDATPFAHLVITDSGIGGLSACAAIERMLRDRLRPTSDVRHPTSGAVGGASAPCARLTYFNAWPNDGSGYNDMPDIAARAQVFDRALNAMASLAPDRIVIACNTLSIVYERTAFRRTPGADGRTPAIPVLGIVDAGAELFHQALLADPASSIVLMGTRTTIESDVHRARLLREGVEPGRIGTVACHGLAKAIETDARPEAIGDLMDGCAAAAAAANLAGDRLLLGLCCTHYSYVSDELCAALERSCGREVRALDPNERLVEQALSDVWFRAEARTAPAEFGTASSRQEHRGEAEEPAAVSVRVVSRVEMSERSVKAIAERIAGVSPATADALLSYTRVPDLF